MALMARGINHYSQVMQYGVGKAANTGFEISGSSITTQNYTSASGSRDIVQSDDEFLSGYAFYNAPSENRSVDFEVIDASQITLGAPVAGAVRLNFSTTGKQVVVVYRKVNDR